MFEASRNVKKVRDAENKKLQRSLNPCREMMGTLLKKEGKVRHKIRRKHEKNVKIKTDYDKEFFLQICQTLK